MCREPDPGEQKSGLLLSMCGSIECFYKGLKMEYDKTDNEKRKGFERAMKELERRFGITWQEI